MPTVRIIIKGKVQGVFFRASAKETAQKVGVKGWVKNTEEADVEAMVSGSQEQLQHFAEWCHRGPARARVTEVIVTEVKDQTFTGFGIIR